MLNSVKYHFVVPFISLFLFTTCKKDKTTSVNGTVVDATRSLSGVSNATVYLQEDDGPLFCFSCLPQTIATFNADAIGHFSFSFEAKKGASYYVVASAPNYFSSIGTQDFTALNSDTKNNIEAKLRPVAWLRLHLKNITPFDGSDQIGINGDFTGSPLQYYGMSVDSTTVFKVYGNSQIDIYWGVIKYSVQSNYSGSVYCPRFDTTSYNINY